MALKSQSGLTLVEVIVTSSIVIVLLGLSASVFGAIRRGREADAQQVLRQYYVAHALYSDEHGGPPPSTTNLISTRLVSARDLTTPLDPNPKGSLNTLYDFHSTVHIRIRLKERVSVIGMCDALQWPRLDVMLPSSPVTLSATNHAVGILPVGTRSTLSFDPPDDAGYPTVLVGPYFRLLDGGSVIRRDIQSDMHRLEPASTMPDFNYKCVDLEQLFFDADAADFAAYCRARPELP